MRAASDQRPALKIGLVLSGLGIVLFVSYLAVLHLTGYPGTAHWRAVAEAQKPVPPAPGLSGVMGPGRVMLEDWRPVVEE